MKKLVIIGANEFQNRLIIKAKALGYETHVFAWKCGDVGEETADFFYPVSIVEKQSILEECRRIQPSGICSIASDLASITVNYVADKLGLTCNPSEITGRCTNKYEMRKCLKKAGLPTPGFCRTDSVNEQVKALNFPLIVKPTDRSGSRSITKVYNEKELENAILRAVSDSFEKQAIVEEYIPGDEYSFECISYGGTHHYLSVTKKYTTGEPNFIETGHAEPAGLSEEMVAAVTDVVFRALDALGVKNGASHSEFRIDENGVIRIIEIGARMGGDCIGSDLVPLSTGYDYVKMVIDVACGKAPELIRISTPKKARIYFIFNEQDLVQFETVKAKHPEKIYRSEIAKKRSDFYDSSSRWGYYILAESV